MTIAQQLPKNLITEAQILNQAYKIMREEMGSKTARYYFYYNEDYITDIVNEYIWLNKQESV